MQESRKQPGQSNDEDQSQAVTDVHRAQEVSLLPLELQITNRAALVHLHKAAKDGESKKLRLSAIAGISNKDCRRGSRKGFRFSLGIGIKRWGSFLDQIPAA